MAGIAGSLSLKKVSSRRERQDDVIIELPLVSVDNGVEETNDSGHRLVRLPSGALHADTVPGGHGMAVTFSGLSYTVKLKKGEQLTLLQSVEGYFRPFDLTALMGPSGSGKTTLLDVLSGRKTQGRTEGKLLYGAAPPTRMFLRRHTGYVEQFDTLIPTLTVLEMLLYTAELKLPTAMPGADKRFWVERTIGALDLHSCANTRIGGAGKRGISGGQAKRANIGVSLITDPHVLFLDEPTSGLDSATSHEVMAAVHDIAANQGTTVCATIHSPSPRTFALFDRLLLLVRGRMVYFGPSGPAAVDYFSRQGLGYDAFDPAQSSQAEWLVELISSASSRPGQTDALADAYTSCSLCSENRAAAAALISSARDRADSGTLAHGTSTSDSSTTQSAHGTGNGHGTHPSSPRAVAGYRAADPRGDKATSVPMVWALRTYFKYRTLRNYRDPLFLSARLVDKLIVLSIMVTLYLHKGRGLGFKDANMTASMLFMWCAAPGFGAAAFLPSIMLERSLYYREQCDGMYYPITYYLAKWIEELVLVVPASLAYCMLLWFAVQLRGNFFTFWIAFLMTQLTAIGLAFTFATVSPTLDFANGAVPSYGATLLFFAGYLVNFNDIPSWWTWYSYLTYLRYPFTAMMVNSYGGPRTNAITVCSSTGAPSEPPKCEPLLRYYGMSRYHAWPNICYIGLWACLFAVLGFVFLKKLKWTSRLRETRCRETVPSVAQHAVGGFCWALVFSV